MRKLILFAAVYGVASSWAQDVKMYSNSSAGTLVDVLNTGNDYKTLLNVSSYATNGGTGVSLFHYGSSYYTGIYSNLQVLNTYSTAYGYSGSISVGDESYSEGIAQYSNAGTGGYHYGLRVGVSGGAYATVYGVYSSAYNGGVTDAFAGFFDGNVAVIGDCDPCTASDAMFKKNIRNYSGGLGKILALKPRVYEMRTEEFKDKMNLGTGTKIGFIAQEVKVVMPELVHTIKAPAKLSAEEQKQKVRKDPSEFQAMNYKDLIPVLVQAMQEQQALIEGLQAEVNQLKASR